jgi:hypothetical protein
MDRRDFGAASKALANVRSNGHCECPGCAECSPWGCKATSATALLQYDHVIVAGDDSIETLRVLCEVCDPLHPRRSAAPRALPNRRLGESFSGPDGRAAKKIR